jgi:hypothetical protein
MLMKTMMIHVLLLLLCSHFWGCTPTALRSYIVLSTSTNPQDQQESTEDLMRLVKEGSIVDQIKAEGHLRQLSQSAMPEQQELAIKPLVWFTFVSDDGYVKEQSQARLGAILAHREWADNYKIKILSEVSELITGQMGTSEEFKKIGYLANAGQSHRLSALKFLVDGFPNLSDKFQAGTVEVFLEFLSMEPKVQNCPPEICNPEMKTQYASKNKNRPKIINWSLKLHEMKWKLWVSLNEMLNQAGLSGGSREKILTLNKDVVRRLLSTELRNKLIAQPLGSFFRN